MPFMSESLFMFLLSDTFITNEQYWHEGTYSNSNTIHTAKTTIPIPIQCQLKPSWAKLGSALAWLRLS